MNINELLTIISNCEQQTSFSYWFNGPTPAIQYLKKLIESNQLLERTEIEEFDILCCLLKEPIDSDSIYFKAVDNIYKNIQHKIFFKYSVNLSDLAASLASKNLFTRQNWYLIVEKKLENIHHMLEGEFLTQENIECIAAISPNDRYPALKIIKFLGKNPCSKNTEIIKNHKDLESLNYAINFFNSLPKSIPFTQEIFEMLAASDYPSRVVEVLNILNKGGILASITLTIAMAHKGSLTVAKALSALYKAGLLDSEMRQVLFKDYSLSLAVYYLAEKKILNSENLEVLRGIPNPDTIAICLCTLDQFGLLTPENRNSVAEHKYCEELRHIPIRLEKGIDWGSHPDSIDRGLHTLYREGILTDENRKTITEAKYSLSAAQGLCSLHRAGILTPETRLCISIYPYFSDNLADAMVVQHKAGASYLDNMDIFMECVFPDVAVEIFILLQEANISTIENKKALFVSPLRVDYERKIFTNLKQSNILNQKNFEIIIILRDRSYDMNLVKSLIKSLAFRAILTQENFDTMFSFSTNPEHFECFTFFVSCFDKEKILTQQNYSTLSRALWLLTYKAGKDIWGKIEQRLTQDLFDKLISCSQQQNPEEAVKALIQETRTVEKSEKDIDTLKRWSIFSDISDDSVDEAKRNCRGNTSDNNKQPCTIKASIIALHL